MRGLQIRVKPEASVPGSANSTEVLTVQYMKQSRVFRYISTEYFASSATMAAIDITLKKQLPRSTADCEPIKV